MVAESKGHGRSARLIANRLRREGEAQGAMGTDPVVLKELQMDEGLPGGVPFGKRMGLTSQSIEPVAQGAVDALDVDGGGCGDHLAPRVARISMESSLPCSSRCLIVWVRRTSAGTSSAGRPRWPERTG